jgi:hypothetical protein
LKVGSYDVNYQGFKGIKIQYKRSNQSETSWRLLETYRDAADALSCEDDEVKRSALLTEQEFFYVQLGCVATER